MYLRSLRNEPQFLRLLLANFISGLGDWFNRVAVTSLVLLLTHSGLSVGIILGLRALVYLLVGPFAGVLADRFSRKTILIIADMMRILFASAFLLAHSASQLWLIYLATVGLEIFSALYAPARSAVVPQLVQPDHVHAANSVNQVVLGSVMALGSLLAGATTAVLDLHAGFVINALSFLISALLTVTITLTPVKELSHTRAAERANRFVHHEGRPPLRRFPAVRVVTLVPLKEGARQELANDSGAFREVWPLLRGSPAIQAMAVFFSLWPFGGGAVNVLISVYAFQVFHAGNAGVGILYGALGIGFFLGGFISTLLLKWLRLVIMLAFVVEGIGQLAASQAPNLWLAALLMVIATTGASVGNGCVSTLIMQVTHSKIQGRIFSLLDTMSNTILCLSMFVSGVVIDAFGPRNLGLLAGIVLIVAALTSGAILFRAKFTTPSV